MNRLWIRSRTCWIEDTVITKEVTSLGHPNCMRNSATTTGTQDARVKSLGSSFPGQCSSVGMCLRSCWFSIVLSFPLVLWQLYVFSCFLPGLPALCLHLAPLPLLFYRTDVKSLLQTQTLTSFTNLFNGSLWLLGQK